MPTYEYQCKKCKRRFERLQPITAPPLKRCVHCGGAAERLIGSGAGLIFKGSGFYSTDYKKSSTGASRPSKAEKTPSKRPDPAGPKAEGPAKK